MRDYWSPSERPLADYHQRGSSTQKYLLDWCRFRHRSGVDTYVDMQSTVSSHLDKSNWHEQSSLGQTKPSKQLCNFILPCPWCMFLQEITSPTSPPGFPPPVFACCPQVFGKKSRTVGALIPSILIALDSKAPIAAQGCRLIYFSLCPTKGSAGVIVFSQTFHRLDNS